VHLRDGGEITATRNACKGDPELPLDREQMILKARELLAFASVNDANAVVDGVLDMAHGGDVPDLKL
ncbi:MAG: MmgE/PrpD family protein, partial [Pseudomonadota bacterium]|nr:MmgE/PrpD family protein [Pseudomonadota bacterium]